MSVRELVVISSLILVSVQGFNMSYIRRNDASADNDPAPARSANNRVIDGSSADPNLFANSAYIYYDYTNDTHSPIAQKPVRCSGMLIAPTWVLTAAHCFDKLIAEATARVWGTTFTFSVGLGAGWARIGSEQPFVESVVARVHVCDAYTHRDVSFDVDVALVELVKGVPSRRYLGVGNTLHPYVGLDEEIHCWAAGFGQTSLEDVDHIKSVLDGPRDLYSYPVTVGTWKRCESLQLELIGKRASFAMTYVCGGRPDGSPGAGLPCTGDAGGPLVCGGRLTGVLAERREERQCAGENAFSVFTYVGHFQVYDWVERIVGKAEMPEAAGGSLMVVRSNDTLIGDVSAAEVGAPARGSNVFAAAAAAMAVTKVLL